MVKKLQCSFQIGRQGITENFLETLKTAFNNHLNVRVSVMKSGGRERQQVKKYSEELLEKLGKQYTAKIVGFTIFIKKWRKAIR